MLLTCSPFNRSAMVETNAKAKAARTLLRHRYGECMYRSDIDVGASLCRYEVVVPARLVLPVWAAIKRRRQRRGAK